METPSLIRYGQMTSDELFVTAEAAANGVVLTNQSATENLVLLKHFGPGNPQAPPPACNELGGAGAFACQLNHTS